MIKATLAEWNVLEALETQCFTPDRRSSGQSLRHSIVSPHQSVYLAREEGTWCGAVILMHHKYALRVYSIAVSPNCRSHGVGSRMMEFVLEQARASGMRRVTLEADCRNAVLVGWYQQWGFEVVEVLKDYYGPNQDAYRMICGLSEDPGTRNLIVVDFPTRFFEAIPEVEVIRAQVYLEDPGYQQRKDLRIFNLCMSTRYQSIGYYVSLLAMARNQTVYPNLTTLRDAGSRAVLRSIGEEIGEEMERAFASLEESVVRVRCLFGRAEEPRFEQLVKRLNRIYEAPLAVYTFEKGTRWELSGMEMLPLEEVANVPALENDARAYFAQRRFIRGILANYQYDLAVLIDPGEENPPSDDAALARFKHAAEAIGFYVEYVTQEDYLRIPEFDALFIRTTTAVNHYTYEFARYAYAEGLVVIDDPWSIMGCSNKLYLFERLRNAGVDMPQTRLFNVKSTAMESLEELTYPLILKQPDSAFSKGVHKVDSPRECRERLTALYGTSELVIAQGFMPTAFDWRIGVLDRQPLFACRYHMASGHWQIFNWQEKDLDLAEGRTETVPLSEVPEKVLRTALKAANLMGDGLYGVDLKAIGDRVYVIEVNDNPNIDHGIEDLIEGESLYRKLARVFHERIESERQTLRPISR